MLKPDDKRLKCQVLLAEDEVELAEALTAALSERGHKIIACNSVTLAQQKLANQHFDIIVFDINLVDGTSNKLIEHLRTKEHANLNKDTPIIIISGFLDAGVVSLIRNYVQGALVKPFTIEDLCRKMDQIVKKIAA